MKSFLGCKLQQLDDLVQNVYSGTQEMFHELWHLLMKQQEGLEKLKQYYLGYEYNLKTKNEGKE